MVNSIRAIQKDYENHLEALQNEKKTARKFIAKIDTMTRKNAELGIEIDSDSLKLEKEIMLEQLDKDIVKLKKVIHRLGKCIDIMLDGEINEEADEVVTDNIE